jgi:hypothetical protein
MSSNFYSILDDDLSDYSTNIEKNKNIEKSKSNKRKRKHNKMHKDNIRSNILTNFMKFSFKFVEGEIKKINPDHKLKKIKYREGYLNLSAIKNLFEKNVDNYFYCNVSSRYRTNRNENEIIFENIKNYISNDFLNMKLKEIYEKYYLKENEYVLKENSTNSLKLENFCSLLNKYKNQKNYEYYEKLKNTGINLIEDLNNSIKIAENQKFLSKKRNIMIKKYQNEKEYEKDYKKETSEEKTVGSTLCVPFDSYLKEDEKDYKIETSEKKSVSSILCVPFDSYLKEDEKDYKKETSEDESMGSIQKDINIDGYFDIYLNQTT